MVKPILERALANLAEMLPKLAALEPQVQKLGQTLLGCWEERGKVLIAGNGGSATDAMHLAEELVVRFRKNRRALAAMALCDPGVVTCAGNDFGYEQVFSRQLEALGNPGDVFISFSTSGNSPNLLRAISAAKDRGMATVAFLGPDGGKSRGLCDIELCVPTSVPHHVQEGHKILYHVLCEWIDAQVA